MPIIPQKTQTKTSGQVNLGREQKFDLPGISELVLLEQFDSIAKSSGDLAKAFYARADKKKAEDDALTANDSLMKYYSATRQAEHDLNQLNGAESKGMFIKMKSASQKFYNSFSKNLTPDQKKIFDPEVVQYDLNVNTRVSRAESAKQKQWVNDSYAAKSSAKMIQSQDNAQANPKLFYQNLEESLDLEAERLKINGIPPEKIETQGRLTKSSAVKSGVLLMAATSLPAAELWYTKASKDKELMPFDKITLRASLDKMKAGKQKIDLRIQAQSWVDVNTANKGFDTQVLKDAARKGTKNNPELRKLIFAGIDISAKERKDQIEEDQRALRSKGKTIIDQAANATEARNLVDSIMTDPKATIQTAEDLEDYIDKTLAAPAGKRRTNPAKYQDFYTLINKNIQGTAVGSEIIKDSNDLSVRIRGFTSVADEKKLIDFWRNKGFLGGTAYDDVLQSFADLKQTTRQKVREDESLQTEYNKYLDYVIPRLPADKALNDFDLRQTGSSFFLLEEGEAFVPDKPFFSVGFDEFEDLTFEEAKEEGLELSWLPGDLDETQLRNAKSLLAQENDLRKRIGKTAIKETDITLRELYKEQIMRLPHKRVTR